MTRGFNYRLARDRYVHDTTHNGPCACEGCQAYYARRFDDTVAAEWAMVQDAWHSLCVKIGGIFKWRD